MATFDFLKHKTYLMLFIVAQFFIMQSQYKAYVDNTTMLKLGKEAIVTNIYVRETQQMRHRTKEIFFDYFNADVNKIIRGYDADVPDIQNIENTTLLKVLYTTDSANGFTHTKMYDNVIAHLKPSYIILQTLFLPIMLSVGILIIAFALWWKEEKVDLTIFKAFWLVFIGEDRPLRTEIIQKVKEHKK
ncbi:MAG: hypothetical protein PHN18_03200 [Sulfurospirillaceae bacterium]|nr:hypothetical protein [Sulfurospirillaceae bacterium]MDD2825586.1 hypothetical protein [Sulfurospirillaceae bacterium]